LKHILLEQQLRITKLPSSSELSLKGPNKNYSLLKPKSRRSCYFYDIDKIDFDPSVLFIPGRFNYPAVDAIGVCQLNVRGTWKDVLVFYQITTMDDHPLGENTTVPKSMVEAWKAKANLSTSIVVFITTSTKFVSVEDDYTKIGLPNQYACLYPHKGF
jgi:hypothetical protein